MFPPRLHLHKAGSIVICRLKNWSQYCRNPSPSPIRCSVQPLPHLCFLTVRNRRERNNGTFRINQTGVIFFPVQELKVPAKIGRKKAQLGHYCGQIKTRQLGRAFFLKVKLKPARCISESTSRGAGQNTSLGTELNLSRKRFRNRVWGFQHLSGFYFKT